MYYIYFDYEFEFGYVYNCREKFNGTWLELQEAINRLKAKGCM